MLYREIITVYFEVYTKYRNTLCGQSAEFLNARRGGRARAEPDGTRAETRFRLSPKRTSPFKSAGEPVQSTAGSRGVRISVSNAGYTTFRGRVRVLATHSTRQFPFTSPPVRYRVPEHSERSIH